MNPWVLITGGAARLGRELCLAFARSGWNVVCHYQHSAHEAQAVAEEVRLLGRQAATVQGSLDDAASVGAIFETACHATDGHLRAVVNNASRFEPDTAGNFDDAALLGQLQSNLLAPVQLGRLLHAYATQVQTRATNTGNGAFALIHVLDQKVFNLNPDYFSYTLSKLALERAVVQQAQALAPLLRVNGIAPGLMYLSGPQSAENFALANQANLLQQAIDPAQVAQTAVFLAQNTSITGARICVDNGQHLVALPRDVLFLVDDLLAKAGHGPR